MYFQYFLHILKLGAYFLNIDSNNFLVLFIDSKIGHYPNIISGLTFADEHIITMIISKDTTGKIQLVVYGFSIWKNFAKRFSDIVLLLESNINLHERNNITISDI